MFSKAEEAEKVINKLIKLNNIQAIGIEQNLQSFRSGFSSAHTLSSLARFNGILSYIVYKESGLRPDFINVNSARKSAGLKVIRKSAGGAPVKEQVLNWAQSKISSSDYEWPTKILKSGPRKGEEIFEPGCYDIADAYVIAVALLFDLNNQV
jgi:hypothetical protein